MPNNQPSSEYLAGSSCAYQQALDDFGITELLETLSHFQDADFDANTARLRREGRICSRKIFANSTDDYFFDVRCP
jgi:hypothetical protein